MADVRKRVADRIRTRLEELGMTGRAFAQALGHGDAWISNLLSYKFALSMNEIDKAADVLKLPPGELVRLTEESWDLTPTEMRVVRALRMLAPVVRDHLRVLAELLVGATPAEVDHLLAWRLLEPEDQEMFDSLISARLQRQHPRPNQGATPDPAPSSKTPDAPAPRIGKPRKR